MAKNHDLPKTRIDKELSDKVKKAHQRITDARWKITRCNLVELSVEYFCNNILSAPDFKVLLKGSRFKPT